MIRVTRHVAVETGIIIAAGATVGIAALVLVYLGNPANMGFCIACFLRDIVGALGLHDFRSSAWIRPEILGIVLGAFLAGLFSKEFRSEGGSAPALRFILGMFVMIGALAFLGCPLRMTLRIAGGDLNAVVGLVGFTCGIAIGVAFLKRGFNLGRMRKQHVADGVVIQAIVFGLLLLVILLPTFKEGGPVFVGDMGHPGTAGTPIRREVGVLISLGVGLVVGVLAQRSRLCLSGGIRDFLLIGSPHLLTGFAATLTVVLIGNLFLGKFRLGFDNQPLAHMAHLWNLLGMMLVGLGSTLLGGCPLRHLVLAGNGNTDSAVTIFGMLAGAALAHNFGFVSVETWYGKGAVLIGLVGTLSIGTIRRESE